MEKRKQNNNKKTRSWLHYAMHVTTIPLIDKCYATKMSTMNAYQCVYSHRTICDKFDDYEGKIAFRSIHQLIVVIWRKDNRSSHLVQLSFSDVVFVFFWLLHKIQNLHTFIVVLVRFFFLSFLCELVYRCKYRIQHG